MPLRLRPFLTRILALLASVLLALAPVNAKPAPEEYQLISSALFAGILENSGAEGVCFSTCREEIQADLRTIGIVNFVAPSTWEGLALELVGAGAGKLLSLGGKTFIKIGDDFVEVADDFATNKPIIGPPVDPVPPLQSTFAPGSVGAANVWTKTARISDAQLPSQGRIKFIPPRNWDGSTPIPRGPIRGFLDRFGNEWTKGPSRTPGQAFEWDVQLSPTGRLQIGWATRDGSHANVSLDGKITHR